MKKDRWETIYPQPKKGQENKDYFLIEEKGCEYCKKYFGWVVCRKGQYQALELGKFNARTAVGTWNESQDIYRVLGWFSTADEASMAMLHLIEVK